MLNNYNQVMTIEKKFPTEKKTTKLFLDAIVKGKHRKGANRRLRKLVATQERRLFGGVFCYCCGHALAVASSTLEHVLPQALGGKDGLENLALSHSICNGTRGHNSTPRAIIAEQYQT